MRSILVGMVCHTQSTQNIKFAESLQFLKKEVRDKVDFFCSKHQSSQQIDTIIYDGHGQTCENYSK